MLSNEIQKWHLSNTSRIDVSIMLWRHWSQNLMLIFMSCSTMSDIVSVPLHGEIFRKWQEWHLMNFWKELNNEIARFFVETGDFCLLCNIVTGFCNIATLHCNIATLHCNIATSEILRTFSLSLPLRKILQRYKIFKNIGIVLWLYATWVLLYIPLYYYFLENTGKRITT